jgi:hypothetical protein
MSDAFARRASAGPHRRASAAGRCSVWVAFSCALWIVGSAVWCGKVAAEPLRGLRSVIHVPAGAPCLAEEPLIAAVRAWLGDSPIDPRLDVLVEEGSVAGVESVSYSVVRSGELVARRTLSPAPARCEAREAVLALAVALALRASHDGELAAFLEPAPVAARHFSLALGAARGRGMVQGLSWGGFAELALDVPGSFGAALELAARYAPDVSIGLDGGSFSALSWVAGLRGCVRTPELGPVRARLCLGADAGVLRAEGSDFDRVWSRSSPYGAAAGSLTLSARLLASLAVELRGAMALPFVGVAVRARRADGVVSQRTLPALGGELGLGLRYIFAGR